MPEQLPEDRLATLLAAQFEAAPDGILLLAADGRVLDCNARFAAQWDVARDALRGLTAAELVAELARRTSEPARFRVSAADLLDRPARHRPLELSLAAGRALVLEAHRLGEPDDRRVGIACYCRDLTRSRRRLRQLRRGRERLSLALSGTSDGLWDWELDSGQVYYSAALGRLLGYRRPELGQGIEAWHGLIHPADRVRVLDLLHRHLAGGSDLFVAPHRLRRRDGTYLWVEARGRAVADQGVPYRMVGTIRDIDEQRRAEEALRVSEDRFRRLVEGSIQGICIHSAYRPLFVNEAFARMYGYDTPDELMARPSLLDIIPQKHHPQAWEIWERRLADPAYKAVLEARNLRRDGTTVWVQVMAHPVDWMGEPAIQFAVVDITERRQFERELVQSRDALERQTAALAALADDLDEARRQAERSSHAAETANRAKSQFLATMSHELRTPLNAVLGFSEIIASEAFGPCGSPQYADYARDIHNSGTLLLDLINDILDIAKIEAGKLKLLPEEISLAVLLGSCLRLAQVHALERGLELTLDVTPDAGHLYADARALKQIVFNLVSNAIKFTARGGSVTLSARGHPSGATEIAVADTGVGIPAHHIERVLRPFEQLDNGYNREVGGTGLGLALVKSLAELHGGALVLDSQPGVGTTARVLFPRAGAAEAAD